MRHMRNHHHRSRRASVMIEFVAVLPALLGLLLLSVDLGRMMVLNGYLSDITYSTARAGAQSGDPPGTVPAAFDATVDAGIPMLEDAAARTRLVDYGTTAGAGSTVQPRRCHTSRPYVVVRAEMEVAFITPGLGQLLNMFSDTEPVDTRNGLAMNGAAVALCQVARR